MANNNAETSCQFLRFSTNKHTATHRATAWQCKIFLHATTWNKSLDNVHIFVANCHFRQNGQDNKFGEKKKFMYTPERNSFVSPDNYIWKERKNNRELSILFDRQWYTLLWPSTQTSG
jgi:hypothetical protein